MTKPAGNDLPPDSPANNLTDSTKSPPSRRERRKRRKSERKNESSEETNEHKKRHKRSLKKLENGSIPKLPDEDPVQLAKEVNEKDYQIISLLGVGSQGRVYLVRLTDTDQYFAMKVFRKDRILPNAKTTRSILTEHRFLAQTNHPFITKLYHSFHSHERLYMVMEYCPGGELLSIIKKQPDARLNEDQVRFYASEVVLVLEYVHSKGYIYRDLKPENILLHLDGHVRVADFGLSKQAEEMPQLHVFERRSKSLNPFKKRTTIDIQQGEVLRTNSLVGSIHYLAPEVVKGEDYDVIADWWAFGVLLYDLFYGYPPFRGHSNREIIVAISQCDYRFPDSIPISSTLKSLIKGLLKLDPKKRICAKHGASDIKRHPFFAGTNWGLLRNRTPPIIPHVSSAYDTSNFEVYEEDEDSIEFQFFSELPEDTYISMEDQQKFDNFFYLNDDYGQQLWDRKVAKFAKDSNVPHLSSNSPEPSQQGSRKHSKSHKIRRRSSHKKPRSRRRAATVDMGTPVPKFHSSSVPGHLMAAQSLGDLPGFHSESAPSSPVAPENADDFNFENHINEVITKKGQFDKKRAKQKIERKESATHSATHEIEQRTRPASVMISSPPRDY